MVANQWWQDAACAQEAYALEYPRTYAEIWMRTGRKVFRMSAILTATELRGNIYRILDEILESGRAQEVVRKGRKLLIVPAEPKRRRLDNLPRKKITNCTFDELVATSWEDSWNPPVPGESDA